ncbi:ABC transporter permease [Leucobacter soli]|uniref:Autoinducer 2 import system permease protein LsrD n=1 Tax=Leucobacter soli TaxID=2812850 RepID=A0A916NNC0_9MICO|nr:ABC transporter permease [Leucobacter soli]CAG7611977.1 L-arabinose transport system permease protein AraH [Leucobacter soli]
MSNSNQTITEVMRTPVPAKGKQSARARALSIGRDFGIVGALLLLFVLLSIASPAFLTPLNLSNLLDGLAPMGILAIGMTLVIIAGGFDLSIGAIFAVGAIVAAMTTNATGSAVLGLLAGLLSGAGLGTLNGLSTTYGKLNPFVATIASTMVFAGIALSLTDGKLIVIQEEAFKNFAQPRFLGLKVTVYIFIAVILLYMFLLNRTVFGRHVFAVGGNAAAARMAGVRVNRTRALTYVLMGFCAALAGIMSASRTGTVDAGIGSGIEFTAIAAVLVGGTSVMGGAGAIWRTVVGVLLLQLIGNGFNLLGVQPTYQRIFTGLIIALAVGWDSWIRASNRR